MNYFEFFNIPIAFRVDKSDLRVKFLSNSKRLHPDVNISLTEEESMNDTALNNKAYSVLKDDSSRILYLLEEIFPPSTKPQLSPLFLADMMEVNEELMDAKMEDDVELIQNVSDKLIELNSNIETELEVLKNDYDSGSKDAIEEIRELVLKRNYIQRSLSQV